MTSSPDPTEFASLTDAIIMAIEARLGSFLTALPAIVSRASTDGHTLGAKSAILGLVRDTDGDTATLAMPEFETVPTHFAGGGRMVTTHPHAEGDEGLLVILSRAIDAWHQSGGVQAPVDSRVQNLSDHVFLNGMRSDPRKLKNVNSDAVHTRSVNGKITSSVHPDDGAHVKVVDPSDSSSDPFNSATKYYETKTHPTSGVSITRESPQKHHTITMTDAGIAMSVLDKITGQGSGFSLTPPAAGGGGGGGMSFTGSGPGGLSAGPDGIGVTGVKTLRLIPITVAELPAASSSVGQIAFVTDATSLTNGSTVAGGGSSVAVVKCDGVNWIVLG